MYKNGWQAYPFLRHQVGRCDKRGKKYPWGYISECPACGDHRSITKLIDYEGFCGNRPSRGLEEDGNLPDISVRELKARLGSRGDVFLLEGFTRVRNLVGGIDQWVIHIDPSLPRY